MNIHLLYSLKTGLLMSHIIPADEAESAIIDKTITIPEGQADLVITEKEYGGPDVLQSIVTKATGLAPVIQRYAIVDNKTGEVLAATNCTEDTTFEGCTLIASADAREGWLMTAPDVFIDMNPPDPIKVVL